MRVPQCTSRRSYGVCQNAATAARISSSCAADMRACGGISSARNSTRPSRPDAVSGCIQLVDAELGAMRVAGHVGQQMAEHPIDQPGRHLLAAA